MHAKLMSIVKVSGCEDKIITDVNDIRLITLRFSAHDEIHWREKLEERMSAPSWKGGQ